MTATQADTVTELQRTIAELRRERDAALAQRNSEFGERIEHQAATIEVLKAMSASPGDPQPVFDLIVTRARDLCGGYGATMYGFDGALIHWRAATGVSDDPSVRQAVEAMYPMAPSREWPVGRAIMDRQIIHISDLDTEPGLNPAMRGITAKSSLVTPLVRGDVAIGALALGSRQRGRFSHSQIELLKTFAEQAVIAITSAETYRALQTRTTHLQQSLEYQTTTSDVLKVISRSTFDLEPVLNTLVETAARLCVAEAAHIVTRDRRAYRVAATFGHNPETDAFVRGLSFSPGRDTVVGRVLLDGQVVHLEDNTADPEYHVPGAVLRGAYTQLGVPLLREGDPVGVIVLVRFRVEPFTERQIELVSTFADQAVIAIENTRLLTEQREALEQQTATAEVLQVINASPGNLSPVFEAILHKAHSLCAAAVGALAVYDGEFFRAIATLGYPEQHANLMREPYPPNHYHRQLLHGDRIVHIPDVKANEFNRDDEVGRSLRDGTDVRTGLAVPLRKDGSLLGYISAFRREVRLFSEKEIALLENFAAQAVIAMENARLITEQREALEQQTATAEVLQVINASPGNLTPVFDAMLEKAMRLCEAAIGVLFIADGDVVRVAQSRNVPPDFRDYLEREPPRLNAGSLLSRAMREQTVLNVTDLRETAPFRDRVSLSVAAVELGGIRSICWAPLVHQTRSLGLFAIFRQEVRAFSSKQIALLENFAAQAVIAMENARLLTEQREALEQQTATAEVLQTINASPGDLVPVFDAILDKAMRLCGVAFGILNTWDGEFAHVVAMRGCPPALAERVAARGPTSTISPAIARLLKTKRPVHVPDVMTGEGYRNGHPDPRALVELGGARTFLAVPLGKDEVLLGYIAVYRQEVRNFSDKEIALLENFAAQAVIAMENARLLTEQREALEQQTGTAEVLQVINASPGNLTPVFEAILEKAMRLCEAAFGSLYTYDGERFLSAAQHGVPAAYAEFRAKNPPAELGGGRTAIGRLINHKRPVHILDIMDEELYRNGGAEVRSIVDLGGARTLLNVPLLKDDVLQGYISIYRQEVRAFSDKQIALLENFAAQAVIAMENARLLDEIRHRQEELRITFENMGDGVAMFDETQHLVACNRKFQDILEVPDDIIERRQSFAEYVRYLAERGEYGSGTDLEEQVRRLIEQVGQSRTYERTRPDGWVIEIRHNPVPSGGFVLILSDITERKRNETELRAARDAAEEASRTIDAAYRELKAAQASLIQSEKMASLGQLTAGIAHEIKNPLNFVNNFSDLSVDLLDELREAVAPDKLAVADGLRGDIDDITATLKGNLEKIAEHGRRADSIVKNMLLHSRTGPSEQRAIDVNTTVDEALNLAYHGARAETPGFNITMEKNLDPKAGSIDAFPQEFLRVMLNLISNGFYAARQRANAIEDKSFEPTLHVTTRNLGSEVEIRVRDNGTGIGDEVRDKIFEPFFTTKPAGEGTGLGLSLSYDIVVKQHGGQLTVDSRPNEFTEFQIMLPRRLAASEGGVHDRQSSGGR